MTNEIDYIYERVMNYMKNSKSVSVKDKCKLGGNSDGKSSKCNQGDINNINLKNI